MKGDIFVNETTENKEKTKKKRKNAGLSAFLTALSTYSIIPAPAGRWDERALRYALCFLPAVGALCGAALWGWIIVSRAIGESKVLFAAVAVCIPLLITGGIHLDGYMDTVDALASHQSRERKLEILKDSNCGAFAVIWTVVYLIADFAFLYELGMSGTIAVLCPAFILSRALSAFNAFTLPKAKKSGMLYAFTREASGSAAAAMLIVSAAAAAMMILISVPSGVAAVVAALVSVVCYRAMARKQFGGATGDTAGFFLQICEILMVIGAWIGTLIG